MHEHETLRLDEKSNGLINNQLSDSERHNLSGFMSLLIKINEREQVVPTKAHRKLSHGN